MVAYWIGTKIQNHLITGYQIDNEKSSGSDRISPVESKAKPMPIF
jgi:hypothetical protein